MAELQNLAELTLPFTSSQLSWINVSRLESCKEGLDWARLVAMWSCI